MHQLARLCELFPERRELHGVRRCGVRGTHEITDRRFRDLRKPAESGERRRGNASFPARDRDRLDAELLGELLLGQADAAPRSAQSPPHSAAFVGPQTALLIPDGTAGCVAIP